MTNESVLEEAQRLTHGDRTAAYGHPYDDYSRTAALWSILLGAKLTKPITAHEAALCMIAVKLSREVHLPKRDNMVDAAGYSHVAFKCHEEQLRRDAEPEWTEALVQKPYQPYTGAQLPPLQTFAQREAEATTRALWTVPDCPICGDNLHAIVRSNSVEAIPANEEYYCSFNHQIYYFGKAP